MSAAAPHDERQNFCTLAINRGRDREDVRTPLTAIEQSVLSHIKALHVFSTGEPVTESTNPRVIHLLSQALNQITEFIRASLYDGTLNDYSIHPTCMPSEPASDDEAPQVSWRLAINQTNRGAQLSVAEQNVLSHVKEIHTYATGELAVEDTDPRVVYLRSQAIEEVMDYVRQCLRDGTLANYQGRYV